MLKYQYCEEAVLSSPDANSVGHYPIPTSSSYAEELASFQLMASENPEVTDDDDEPSVELRGIMNWATGEVSTLNPRMQREVCSFIRNQGVFIARYKRPYEEDMGRTRSADSQMMRKAQVVLLMRPQNQSHRSI
ncbi:hypothetical protein V1522DRAFT_414075 [Lipomyces starkeyi]